MRLALPHGALSPLLLVSAACATAQPVAQPAEPRLAITQVAVIDVDRGQVFPDHTVLVTGNRIEAVGPSAQVPVPVTARLIDGSGQYLIPGLVDTHMHRWWSAGSGADTMPLFALLLANGVTTMREASGSGREAELVLLRGAIERGELLAPRLVVSGTASVRNRERYGAADLPDLVRRLVGLGVDGIKVIHLTSDEVRTVVAEARRLGVPVYGHTLVAGGIQRPDLPWRSHAYAADAIAAGVSGIMHVVSLTPASLLELRPLPDGATREQWARHVEAWLVGVLSEWLEMTDAEADGLIGAMLRHGVWLEPTLIMDDVDAHRDRYQGAAAEVAAGMTLDAWRGPSVASAEQIERRQRVMARMRAFVRRFHDAGGMVLTGTDNAPLPGVGIHDELALLVEAGLQPAAALRAATISPARAFQRAERLGTIAPGRLADLVMLTANPLDDIRNTRSISAVVVNGRFLDRPALDGLLAAARKSTSKSN